VLALILATMSVQAQYFQFSQYNFTPQRVNPALVASSDDAQLSFIYRNQSTGGGFRINSNSLNAMYPFLSPKGKRWSGLGLSFLDDRSGQAGIFATQEVGLAYGVNIFVSRGQSISLGAKMLYQSRRMDINGLHTGSQYAPDRGLDPALALGEELGDLKSDYFTFSMGMHWQRLDEDDEMAAYLDLSFFDLNRPDEQFISSSELNPTMVAAGGVRVFRGDKVSVFPQVLYTRSADNNVVNAGAMFRYDLKASRPRNEQYLNFLTSYVFGRSAILGVQFHNARFGVGVSYDFPFLNHNVANNGAIEVGVVFKKPVARSLDNKKNQRAKAAAAEQKPKRLGASVGVKKPVAPPVSRDTAKVSTSKPVPTMSERLRQKQDSIAAKGIAGVIQHDPLVLEKATLRFNFEFNSASPGEDAREYLDELAKALNDNPELRLKLVGHTDNVGSDKFNLRLSLERAQAFKTYLVERGVNASRVTVDGKGMREPLNDNKTPEKQALNRRVEMTILFGQ